jgi:hypothetical protein
MTHDKQHMTHDKQEIGVNVEQGLYTISTGNGYSCLGFDVAFNRAAEIAAALGRPELAPRPENKGTPSGYADYIAVVNAARDSGRRIVLWGDTPQELRNVIERAYSTQRRVRVHYGDKDTGRVWLEELDVIGRIGRSSGWLPCYLLCNNARSLGGGALLAERILRMQDVETKETLYKHASYKAPEFEVMSDCGAEDGYTFQVRTKGGDVQARFKTEQAARNYIAFMRGERMRVN